MPRETDIEYVRRRLQEERERAEKASDPSGYRAHTELAREYERKLRSLIASAPESGKHDRLH